MSPRRPLSRDLHVSPTVRLGRFRCDAGDEMWARDNQVGPWPLLAFPGTAVEILQAGRPAVVATAQQVVLYNPNQGYRRRLVDARGDRCVYLTVDAARLHEVFADVEAGVGEHLDRPFLAASAAIDARVGARALLLAAAAERSGVDPLAVEEEALAIVAAIAGGMRRRASASASGAAASRRRELARAIARDLALNFADGDDLATIAGRVGASPFHAARVFRAATGASIHAYRHQLRLHAALLRLDEADADLATIAVDVGFASHSHLSEAFRRAFGAAPSRLRADLRAGRIDAAVASTIMKAGRVGPR